MAAPRHSGDDDRLRHTEDWDIIGPDPWVTAGAISAIAFVLTAAIFAYVGWRVRRDRPAAAIRRHDAAIQPKPQVTHIHPTDMRVRLANTGGAAVNLLILISSAPGIFSGSGALPALSASLDCRLRLVSPAPAPGADGADWQPVVLVAKDVELRWWDCIAHSRIADLGQWWTARSRELGLADWRVEESDDGLSATLIRAQPSAG
jgi:hypothetical protein